VTKVKSNFKLIDFILDSNKLKDKALSYSKWCSYKKNSQSYEYRG